MDLAHNILTGKLKKFRYGLLPDVAVAALCLEGMVTPFVPRKVSVVAGQPCASFGLDSYGYDARLGQESHFPTVKPISDIRSSDFMVGTDLHQIEIPGHSYVLSVLLESFDIPGDIYALVYGKSTYTRAGIVAHGAPIDPGWAGYYTLQISNMNSNPAIIYPGDGIVKIAFYHTRRPRKTYSGRYQYAKGIESANIGTGENKSPVSLP